MGVLTRCVKNPKIPVSERSLRARFSSARDRGPILPNPKSTAARRTRPRAPRMTSDARRSEILRCALRAFSRNNYMRVTIADLAKEAGISEPVLYKHFASKKELFFTLVCDIGERMVDTWRELVAESSSLVEAL